MRLDRLLPGQSVLIESEEGDLEASFEEFTEDGGALVADDDGELLAVDSDEIVAAKPTSFDLLEQKQPQLLAEFLFCEMLEDEGLDEPDFLAAALVEFQKLDEERVASFREARRRRRLGHYKAKTEEDPGWVPYLQGNKRGGTKRYPRRFNRPT